MEGINFDTRKNLIDYDSVLSNQRELVYKQRDQVLKNSDNTSIIKNMARTVAKDLSSMFKSTQNEVYVDHEALANALNTKLFNTNLISPTYFQEKTTVESEEIIFELLTLSVDTRIRMLGGDRATGMIRDMMIQNLDFQ
ncbi:hypothetical protein FACS1894166_01750 [Bacilli bacterium]|nr:hypothetical protein FACS1894166_01750 [Bacilli bacterium]